jgi:hypothetical protein
VWEDTQGPQEDKPNRGAITPCGQISHSNFNDSYTLALTQGGDTKKLELDVRDSGISDHSTPHTWNRGHAHMLMRIHTHRHG